MRSSLPCSKSFWGIQTIRRLPSTYYVIGSYFYLQHNNKLTLMLQINRIMPVLKVAAEHHISPCEAHCDIFCLKVKPGTVLCLYEYIQTVSVFCLYIELNICPEDGYASITFFKIINSLKCCISNQLLLKLPFDPLYKI